MSLRKNAIYNIILNVSNVLFPFITTPYVSRILGVENIGVVNFAIAYAAYFVLFAMLGVPTYGMRVVAKCGESKEERSKVFFELFSIVTICSLIVSAVYVVSVFVVPTLYEERVFLLIAGMTVFLAPLNIEWYFGGRERFGMITMRSLVIKVVMIAGLFLFVRNRSDVMPYMWLQTASLLLNHIWNWGYLVKNEVKKCSIKSLNIRLHIKPILLLFASSVAISIYTMLDTLMLGFLSNYTEVGYYTSAMKISRLVMPIVAAMSPVVFVRVSALKEQGDFDTIKEVLKGSFAYMYTIAVPVTFGIIVIAPRFVPFFFGEEFIPSTLSLQILSLLILIIGMNNVYGPQLVQGMGHDKLFLKGVLVGTVLNFTLNMILIKPFGSVGASVASVLSETVVTIVMYLFSLRILKLHYDKKTMIAPWVAIIPMFVVSMLVNNFMKVHDVTYLLIVISSSVFFYVAIMYFVFKNQVIVSVIDGVLSKFRIIKK